MQTFQVKSVAYLLPLSSCVREQEVSPDTLSAGNRTGGVCPLTILASAKCGTEWQFLSLCTRVPTGSAPVPLFQFPHR